ncbi:hemolysin III family protein [Undibacterium jejuense]|uniref:Hemolysin III family protein n=1 Tax=Undibacterium jejuense TaxID=1344949 RepID=A0A923HIG1_9BURK|nr:hemolysin III family protein [Undibacterium jejuense]MBC3861364.1 hemolysin III family protein [Undibacterium jejuense]
MYYGEKFNSISHIAGAALAIGGAAVLITISARLGDPWKIVSFSIYGAMLFLLYTISALYHSLKGKAKNVFQKLDHCAIYLLIAGSYTPFTLVTLREHSGWVLFGLEWSLAIIGIVQEILFAKGARWLSLAIYVVMGWLAIAAIVPLMTILQNGFIWLALGGLFYTVGIIFYATDEKLKHGHGIWHLFVLAGSMCQYFAVLFYVA